MTSLPWMEGFHPYPSAATATSLEEHQHRRRVEESTSDTARILAEQAEENRRLRYLTNLLAFAVIYDVVNGTFDDHTWWTTLVSAGAGVLALVGALLLGRWRTRRRATPENGDG